MMQKKNTFCAEAGRSEPDPFSFDISSDAERNQKCSITISVIHHFLRIDKKPAVHISHRIGLKVI